MPLNNRYMWVQVKVQTTHPKLGTKIQQKFIYREEPEGTEEVHVPAIFNSNAQSSDAKIFQDLCSDR